MSHLISLIALLLAVAFACWIIRLWRSARESGKELTKDYFGRDAIDLRD